MQIVSHNTLAPKKNIKQYKSSTPNDHRSIYLTSRHVLDSEQLKEPNVAIQFGKDFISF